MTGTKPGISHEMMVVGRLSVAGRLRITGFGWKAWVHGALTCRRRNTMVGGNFFQKRFECASTVLMYIIQRQDMIRGDNRDDQTSEQ